MQREGYLIIDHRASPGLPADIARMNGFDPHHTGEGKLFEAASLTCRHCKTVVIKNPLRMRERENCPKCSNHYICDFCAAEMRQPDYNHLPFEAKVEATVDALAKGILGSSLQLLK